MAEDQTPDAAIEAQPEASQPAEPVVTDEALLKAQEFIEEEEGAANRLAGWRAAFITLVAVGVSLFHLYAIAIGSNRRHGRFGRPARVVEAAIARLDRDFGLFDAAPILLNRAHGGAGRDFANSVALVESGFQPPEMLRALKRIERDFGRRRGRRWGSRVLDLDIVDWSGPAWRSRSLKVPHPAAVGRAFVIEPLAIIAPRWRLGNRLTARHLAHRLARRRPRR